MSFNNSLDQSGSANGAALQRHTDWHSVRGRTVEVRHCDAPAQIGVVEEVTYDGAILWLAAYGPLTRIMIEKAEGYEIWAIRF